MAIKSFALFLAIVLEVCLFSQTVNAQSKDISSEFEDS